MLCFLPGREERLKGKVAQMRKGELPHCAGDREGRGGGGEGTGP